MIVEMENSEECCLASYRSTIAPRKGDIVEIFEDNSNNEYEVTKVHHCLCGKNLKILAYVNKV